MQFIKNVGGLTSPPSPYSDPVVLGRSQESAFVTSLLSQPQFPGKWQETVGEGGPKSVLSNVPSQDCPQLLEGTLPFLHEMRGAR